MISIRKTDLRNSYDVIVIGAGVGGMVCAGFLSRAGKSVLLLDHHYLPGGCCTAFPRKGYKFDAAVHHISACGRYGIIGQILSRFGLSLEFVHLDPMDTLTFPDFDFQIPADLDCYAEQLGRRFPPEKQQIDQFFKDFVRFYRQIVRREGALLDRYRHASFDAFLGDYFSDPDIGRIIGAQWGYLGTPVGEISAVGMCQMLVSYLKDGAYYPKGSTQAFSNALARNLLHVGAHVRLRTGVSEILVEHDRVAGVRTEDGRAIRAAAVVSNVDARQLFQGMLPDQVCSEERARMGELRVAPSYYGLYLAVPSELDLARLPRGFYYLSDEEGGRTIEWIYLSVPTRYDPSLARPGKQIIAMTIGVRSSEPEYSAWQDDRSQMVEHIVQYLDTRVPGLRWKIDLMESASPRTIARYIRTRDGVAYGWAVLPDQSGDARFPPRTSLSGLYLAGQWTSPGPGVAAVAASGWATASLISGGN